MTKYTRVSFNESFQDWAHANQLACSCALGGVRLDEHAESCSLSAASTHWREVGQALYRRLAGPKPVGLAEAAG